MQRSTIALVINMDIKEALGRSKEKKDENR